MITSRETELTTQLYTHFFGLRRSGNHAVINWIVQGLIESGQNTIHFNSVAGYPLPEREPSNMREHMKIEKAARGLLNYEDIPYSKRFELRHYWEFSLPTTSDIILLRSFPNVAASRFQRMRTLEQAGRHASVHHRLGWSALRDIWVEYARILTCSDAQEVTSILYDSWFTDKGYRDALACKLGFVNEDAAIGYIPDNAQGSSFDGFRFEGRAQAMDTLHRWKQMLADTEGRAILRTYFQGEVADLNGELFGYPTADEL